MSLAAAIKDRRRPGQRITLRRRGGGVVDLTTATTIIGVLQNKATLATRPIYGTLTRVGSGADGQVDWDYAATDVAEAGYFWLQLTVTFADGKRESTFVAGWEVADALVLDATGYLISPGAAQLDITHTRGRRLALSITLPPESYDLTATGTYLRGTWRQDHASGAVVLSLGTVVAGDGFYVRGPETFDLIVSADTLADIGTAGADWTGHHLIEVVPGGVVADAVTVLSGVVQLVVDIP